MAFPVESEYFSLVTMDLPDCLMSSDLGPKTHMVEILIAAAYHASDYSEITLTRQPTEALTPG